MNENNWTSYDIAKKALVESGKSIKRAGWEKQYIKLAQPEEYPVEEVRDDNGFLFKSEPRIDTWIALVNEDGGLEPWVDRKVDTLAHDWIVL